MNKKIVIFDIDGTLADPTHRVHHLTKTPKDWDAFYGACMDDIVIKEIAFLYRLLVAHHEYKVILVSGRREADRWTTRNWFKKNALPIEGISLFLRAPKDKRPDTVYKKEVYDWLVEQGMEIAMVFEDRQSVVDMWRDLGIRTLQVAPGKF